VALSGDRESCFRPSKTCSQHNRGVAAPRNIANAYWALFAYSMYLRIQTAKEEKVTCDSALASSVWWRNKLVGTFHLGSIECKEYIDWRMEIIKLNYRLLCCIGLVCFWIPTSLDDIDNKVVKDKYKSALENFQSPLPLGPSSFALPIQYQ
jgi:hypothetical protein